MALVAPAMGFLLAAIVQIGGSRIDEAYNGNPMVESVRGWRW